MVRGFLYRSDRPVYSPCLNQVRLLPTLLKLLHTQSWCYQSQEMDKKQHPSYIEAGSRLKTIVEARSMMCLERSMIRGRGLRVSKRQRL